MWAGGGGGEEETRGEGTEEKCLCMCWPETRHASHVEGVGLELPPPARSSRWRCAGETNAPLSSFVLSSHTHTPRGCFLLTAESLAISERGEVRLALHQNNSALMCRVLWKTSCGALAAPKGEGEGGRGEEAAWQRGVTAAHTKPNLLKWIPRASLVFWFAFRDWFFFFSSLKDLQPSHSTVGA